MSLDIRLPILLRQLRLPTVAANYRRFAQEAAQSGQPYEEYLLALLEHEANQRDVNRRKRRIREARFPVLRTLDEFDFAALPSLSRTKVADDNYKILLGILTSSSWCQRGKWRAARLRFGFPFHKPSHNASQVHRCRRSQVLQVSLGQAYIAGTSQTE
jgi:hypothetical protein